jgi:hypothetical protein
MHSRRPDESRLHEGSRHKPHSLDRVRLNVPQPGPDFDGSVAGDGRLTILCAQSRRRGTRRSLQAMIVSANSRRQR